MNRSFSALAAGAFLIFSGAAAHATLIDFTIPGATSFAPIPPTYQPLAPTDTIAYTNVGVFNGTPDHTSGTTGGNNYYSYPSSGNGGTELFSFSAPLTVSSFWYGVFDNNNGPVQVTYNAYSGPNATGTLLSSQTLTPTLNPNPPGPIWTEYASAVSGVESITFGTTNGGTDAVNIDDISVTVPEPASLGLGAIGMIGLLARRRKAASR